MHVDSLSQQLLAQRRIYIPNIISTCPVPAPTSLLIKVYLYYISFCCLLLFSLFSFASL